MADKMCIKAAAFEPIVKAKVAAVDNNFTTLTCYHYNKAGHIWRECPKKQIFRVCNTPGFVFDCPNCKPSRDSKFENERNR